MTRSTLLVLSLLFSSALLASNYTVAPTSGTTGGGTQVTIKGEFGNWPYTVLFGGTSATSTVKVDAQTLVAMTPTHLPGPSRVVILEGDFGISTDVVFTFEGGVPPTFERILVPLLTPPVQGAFGSEFHTSFRVHNSSDSTVQLYGLRPPCVVALCPPIDISNEPMNVNPNTAPGAFIEEGTPGRFLYVPTAQVRDLVFSLRVYDVTRAALNFGTEIPVVRERQLTGDRITLLGVPTSSRFRNTLRIYGEAQTFLVVMFSDGAQKIERYVTLQAGRDVFEPAYAAIGDFPAFASGGTEITVTIAPPPLLNPLPPVPVWAFISVTNNETQVITTITPQR